MLTKPADPVLVRFAHVQTTIVGASSAQDQLQKLQQKQQQQRPIFPSSLTTFYHPLSSAKQNISNNNHSKNKQQQQQKESSFSNWVESAWDWCQNIVSSESSNRYKQSKVFAFERPAKHECEAAGKLHQLLEDHFNGKLSGRIYPTGQIVWSGTLLFGKT